MVLSRRQALRGQRAGVLLLACWFGVSTAALGQDVTFSADVKVVNLLASVRDKRGQLIRDLTKDDFTLLENGRPQKIQYFSRETKLPLTVGLMVDTSTSQERVMDAERVASFRFLDEALRDPKDQAFIVQFDIGILMRQRLTSSLRDLQQSLSQVDTPTRKELQLQQSGGTRLFDALVKTARETMKNLEGRKAFIIMSDGVDVGSDASLQDATAAAVRTDTIVYSILFADPGAYGLFGAGGAEGRHALQHLSLETGGEFFEVSKKQTIDQIFDVIQDELRGQYSVGFVSDVPVEISEFRKLKLSAKQRGLAVQAREKYWAQR